VQASHDWFWFRFLLDKEVTRALFKPIAQRCNTQTQKMRTELLSILH